jgi:small subunit ribosomal protein S8
MPGIPTDPIADMFTRIRNGQMARKMTVEVPHSRHKVDILKVLEAEGYIGTHEISTESKFPNIRITLKYDAKRKPVIQHIQRVSKLGGRVYVGSGELRPLRMGLGSRIMTTSMGVMSDREARRRKIGGEVIGEVW